MLEGKLAKGPMAKRIKFNNYMYEDENSCMATFNDQTLSTSEELKDLKVNYEKLWAFRNFDKKI